ncbi:MAG: carboxypeptidase regulatory-like domain-containing protein, partial [Xanthomonadales bacterium]|nr:carboxypeptidase regulatory-like domain-containing protein [Xanthomonadales bacterium]
MQAGLTGRVLSADTGLPISGATLALGGTAVATLTSNDSGHLQSASLIAGSYLATLSYPGMHSIEFELSLADGRILDLGDLRMYQGDAGANLAIVRGRITRAADGAPIPGASILIEQPPIQVSSGGDGSYQILQVPAGHVRIIVSAAGYSSRFAEVDIGPSAVIEFSVALQADANATGATVRGT